MGKIRKIDEKLYKKSKNSRTALFQEILNEYDFFGIVERFDESLVALRLLLGLDAGDIIYLSAKKSGEEYKYNRKGRCIKMPSKTVWPGQEKYFSSSSWT